MSTDYNGVSPAYRGYAVVLVIVTFTLATVDRSILTILIEPIRHEFGLSDTQIGMLTGFAFAVPLSLVILPMGVLADRTNRVRLVSALMMIWSALTAFSGLAQSYVALVLARMGLGAAEAGAAPIFTSLASDMFSKEKRGSAMGWLYFASPLGVTLGFLVGGLIAANFTWRTAFFIVGVPGMILGVITLLTLREPRRETLPSASGAERASTIGEVIRLVARRRVLLLLLLAATVSVGGQAAVSAFVAPFLIRVHGLDVGQTGTLLALTYGIGGMVGLPLGGIATDAIRRRWRGRELGLFGIANCLVALVAAAAFLAPDAVWAIALLALYSAGAHLYYGVTFSSFLTETPPLMRGGATATLLLATNLVGYGGAPQLAGLLSDGAAALDFANPLRVSLVCCGMLFAVGGVFLILAGQAMQQDAPGSLRGSCHP